MVDYAHAERAPLPFESALVDDCLGRGKSMQEGGAIYILDRNNNILMGYNEKYQKQLKEFREQETVKEISEDEITTGNLKNDFYYMKGELENASNKLVYLVPQKIPERKQKDSPAYSGNGIAGNRIHGLYYVIFFQKLARPLVEVAADSGKKLPMEWQFWRNPEVLSREMSKFCILL